MNRRSNQEWAFLLAFLLSGVLASPGAFAAIPDPPIVLFGQVGDGAGGLLTSGTLNVTFTPDDGGTRYTATATLELLEGANEDFSYQVRVPLVTLEPGETFVTAASTPPAETAEKPQKRGESATTADATGAAPARKPGGPDPEHQDSEPSHARGSSEAMPVATAKEVTGAIVIPATDASYTLELAVAGQPTLSTSRPFTIGRDTRGLVERVDIDAPAAGFHTGDVDANGSFSLSELALEIELFSATSDHRYYSDAREKILNPAQDGYRPGDGPHLARQHSGDFERHTPWRISLGELLRMIELFTATDGHSYSPAPDNLEDGFTYVQPGMKTYALAMAHMSMMGAFTHAQRNIAAETSGDGIVLHIHVSFTYFGASPLTSAGLEESLPSGWRFLDVSTTYGAPSIAPEQGADGLLSFSWFPTPANGGAVNYRIVVPWGADIAAGLEALQGRVLYRVLYAEGVQEMLVENANAAESDVDGDGIPDLVEGYDDPDQDGIPNALDTDSDEDGLPDDFEGTDDVDGDGDGNFVDPDSDGDGVPDADEHGDDLDDNGIPDAYDPDAQVPLQPAAWIALMLILAALGIIRQRRARRNSRPKNT